MKKISTKVISILIVLVLALALTPAAAFAVDLSNVPYNAEVFNIGETVTFGAPCSVDHEKGVEIRYQWKKFTVDSISTLTIKVEVEPGQYGKGNWYNQLRIELYRPDASNAAYDYDNKRYSIEALGDKNLTDTGTYKVLPGTYYLRAYGGQTGHTAYGKATVTAEPVSINPQYSADKATAPLLSPDKEYNGVIAYDGHKTGTSYYTLDRIYYKYQAPYEGTVKISFDRADVNYSNYMWLRATDANGSSIAPSIDLNLNPKQTVDVKFPKAGTYYFEVGDGTGGRPTEFNLKISTTPVKSVKLNKTSLTVVKGTPQTLKAAISPANATNMAVTWASSNTKVAKVDKNGKVTGVSGGTAKITATTADGKKTASCTVNVKVPASKLTMSKSSATIGKGKTLTLKAKAAPSSIYPDTIKWTTNNKNVATVDDKGMVKGIKKGTATITAKTWDGKTAKCKVTVK